MHRRSAAALMAAATTATITLMPAGTVEATTGSVSPGDDITHLELTGSERCTLGYTFTAATTYGVTAGHCNAAPGHYVLDRSTGATGRFIVSVHDTVVGGADYGLIDFGATRSVPIIKGVPVTGVGAPDPEGDPVCHTGIATGVACGHLVGELIGRQYLTTGMPRSIPGDSGGPVWQLSSGVGATVVGIWLGERDTDDGAGHHGRFIGLIDVLTALGFTTIPD